jgi:hypothetical protein
MHCATMQRTSLRNCPSIGSDAESYSQAYTFSLLVQTYSAKHAVSIKAPNYACDQIKFSFEPPKEIKNENNKTIGFKYEAKVTFKIKLEYNEIFYPRPGDKSPDGKQEVTESMSEAVYLHEVGHQLDAKEVFSKFDAKSIVLQDSTWDFVSQKINGAQDEITVVAKLNSTFYGDKAEANEKAKSWIKSTSESLSEKFESKINEENDEAAGRYHNKHGDEGNPWDGKK